MGISNAYADTAPIHSDRLPNEPLHSHVAQLHALLMEHAPTILASPMQQQHALQREAGSNPELVPTSTKGLVGTIACDADDSAQQFSLPAGGHALTAAVDNLEVCVTAEVGRMGLNGVPIGTCNSLNSNQTFRFSDDAKGRGTLCSAGGCLCAADPERAQGAVGIAASEQTVRVMNASAARLVPGCTWVKTPNGQIESLVQPPPPAECTGNTMLLYLGETARSSHLNGNTLINPGNYTVPEAKTICDANFQCAGFTYQDASTNGTSIDCDAVHEIIFREFVTYRIGNDKSWKTFSKLQIAYPYPDPRSKGPQERRCLTSGFASPECGICGGSDHDPCTCAFVYGRGASALGFVQNDGTKEVNFSFPGSPTQVLSVAPRSISLVFGGKTIYNTASIEGCADSGTGGGASCSLQTVRQNITIAGNSSSIGNGSSVLSWRRWTEPAFISNPDAPPAIQKPRPMEQLGVTADATDYLFYQRGFALKAAETATNASVYLGTRVGSALSVFVDGVFKGTDLNLAGKPYSTSVILSINIGALSSGDHTLTIVSAVIGIMNYPVHGTAPAATMPAHGITGDVVLGVGSANISLTTAPASSPWSHRAGLAGEREQVFAGSGGGVWSNSSSVVVPSGVNDTLPLSWFRTTFTVPSSMVALAVAGKASILLDPAGMARGHFYLNGADLGRYYPAAPGAASAGLDGMLYLPPSLLKDTGKGKDTDNVLVFGEELGATQPTAVRIVLSTLAAPPTSTLK